MIPRYTPIRRKRATPRRRKTVVRLEGQELASLRRECFIRDGGKCQKCGIYVYFQRRFTTDPEAYEMAHLKSRGASGSDTLDNVRCLCALCHRREHSMGRREA